MITKQTLLVGGNINTKLAQMQKTNVFRRKMIP